MTQLADHYISHHRARRTPTFFEDSAKDLPHIGIRVDVTDRADAFIEDIVIPFQLAKVRESQTILKAFSEFVAKFSLDGPGREESAGNFQPSRWLLECLVSGSSLFKSNGELYVSALSNATSLDHVITADNKILFHQVPTPYVMAAFCFLEDLDRQIEAVAKFGEEDFDRARTRADSYFENNNSNADPTHPATATSGPVSQTPTSQAQTFQFPSPAVLTDEPASESHETPALSISAPATPSHEYTIAPTAENPNAIGSSDAARNVDDEKQHKEDHSSEPDMPEFQGKHIRYRIYVYIIAYTVSSSCSRFCCRIYTVILSLKRFRDCVVGFVVVYIRLYNRLYGI